MNSQKKRTLSLDRRHLAATYWWPWRDLSAFLHRGQSGRYKDTPYPNSISHPPTAFESIFHFIFTAPLFFYPSVLSGTPTTLFFLIPYLPMVASTRLKNKLAHPAAPVMTTAAKQKAGIKTKPRPRRVTKDQTIRELQARIAALENPDEEPFSKEPLVCYDPHPPQC